MAGRWDCFHGLPPGWEAKFDFKTGRYYFMDNTTKQTTWEDPRLKSCPPPPPHPETLPPEMRGQSSAVAPLDVIPFKGCNLPVVPSMPYSSMTSNKFSELEGGSQQEATEGLRILSLGSKTDSLKRQLSFLWNIVSNNDSPRGAAGYIYAMYRQIVLGLQDFFVLYEQRPPLGSQKVPSKDQEVTEEKTSSQRIRKKRGWGRRSNSQKNRNSTAPAERQSVEEPINLLEVDNEMDVAKISAMFPTVPEERIKELLKKYHQRTAVVISALQVARYPLATPGPYGTFTPPPARHFLPAAAALAAFQTGKSHQAVSSSHISSSMSERSMSTQRGATFSPPPPHQSPAPTGITSITSIPVSAAPLSFTSSRPSSPDQTRDTQSRGSYERVRGTHLLERIGSVGDQSMMGDNLFGSPRMSTRSYTTTKSTSEFYTRSVLSSPRPTYSPRPSPHSPKIKLRYLKGLFPTVDPTIILDVLTQCHYNVKDTCELLESKGHTKKDTSLLPPQLKERRPTIDSTKESPKPSPAPSRPRFLSEVNNRTIRARLAESFPDITPTVLRMALQSVGHDEHLAKAVLESSSKDEGPKETRTRAVTPGDARRRWAVTVCDSEASDVETSHKSSRAAVRPVLARPRVNFAWTHSLTQTDPSVSDRKKGGDSSKMARGPNPTLHKGPCDDLLLTDYTPWHGPNSENAKERTPALARGPNVGLRRSGQLTAKGPNSSLAKGPNSNLALGSIFMRALRRNSPPSSKRL